MCNRCKNAQTNSLKSRPFVWIVTLSIARPKPSTTTRHKSVNALLNNARIARIGGRGFSRDITPPKKEKGLQPLKPQPTLGILLFRAVRCELNRRSHLQLQPRPQRRRRSKRHRVQLRRRRRLPKYRRAIRQPVHAQSLVYRRARIRRRVSEPQHISLFRIPNFNEPALASNQLKIGKTCFRHMRFRLPFDFPYRSTCAGAGFFATECR